jgi:hypothetical protein
VTVRRPLIVLVLAAAGLLASGVGAPAQDGADLAELARKTQNPISSMISLPFESTFNLTNGRNDETQYFLQIQPVVPIGIGAGWNLITRPIIPLISQPEKAQLPVIPIVTSTGDRTFGIGDINISFFLSPDSDSNFTWGAGPVFLLPTASDEALGAEKWGAGPTAVGLYQAGKWSMGMLVGHIWSFGGTSKRDDVDLTYLQPFVNYNLTDGWYLSTSPIISANWEATSGQKWTVPIGAGIGKIFAIGNQRMNARFNAYYNVERPSGAANTQLQFTIQFLFPRS